MALTKIGKEGITGISNSSNATAITIDSSENVGIGNSSPSSYYSNSNQLVVGSGAARQGITIASSTTTIGQLAFADGTSGDARYEGWVIYDHNTDHMSFGTSASERMRIDSAGRISINTTAATELLNVAASAGNGAGVEFAGNGTTVGSTSAFYGQGSGSDAYVWNRANSTILFGTNNAEKMRLDSSGNLLVGTTSTTPNPGVSLAAGGTIGIGNSNGNSGTSFIEFRRNATQIGSITQNGTTGVSFNSSSDYRLKENVTADWDATTRLKQLNPVRFNFIADADTTVDGFLAHEVQDIVPEAIHGTKDGMRDEEYQVSAATGDIYTPAVEATYDEDGVELTAAVDEVIHSTDVERPKELAEGQLWRETTAAVMGTRSVPDYQGIDQSKLVPLLCKTILELEARIVALETA